jgi:L-threonylcarbamoyladenylate synthase
VDNQRIIWRPSFGGKDARRGSRIECVRAQTIDGFGGKRHQSAAPQRLAGVPQRRAIGVRRIDLTTSPPRLLRPGLVSPRALEAVIGSIAIGETSAAAAGQTQTSVARSPGLLERHYAPSTPLESGIDTWPRVNELCRQGNRVGWLSLAPPPDEPPSGLFVLEMPADVAGYSAALYAALHTLDAMRLERIVVELPPTGDDWLAIHDRLRRAAALPGR